MGKTSAKVKNRYNAKAYDRVTIVLRKDGAITKDSVQAAAEQAGVSVNAYIVDAVKDRMATGK